MNMDELLKKAQAYLDNEKGKHGEVDLSVIDSAAMFGMGADEVAVSVNRLDLLVASMWLLMKEKGFEDEELIAKIAQIIEEQNGEVYRHDTIKCPKCGNNIQEIKKSPLTARCFYCGSMYILYPFNDRPLEDSEIRPIEGAPLEPLENETPEKSEEPSKPAEPEIPTHFEPYDVSKDLRFDEFE